MANIQSVSLIFPWSKFDSGPIQTEHASQILEKSSYNMSAEGASEFILEQSYRITCKYYNEIIP